MDSAGTATDEDGLDLTDLAAARVVAVKGARDILAAEVRYGEIDLDWRIEITDESGAVALILPFSDALLVAGIPK